MNNYITPGKGNFGEFGTEDAAGRPLDRAGKLVHQTARPDLKEKDFKDPKRKPTFLNK